LHAGVYQQAGDRSAWFAWHGLEEHGWKPGAGRRDHALRARLVVCAAVPSRARPHRAGLLPGLADGTTTELQAPFWLYGAAPHELVTATQCPTVSRSVDGHLSDRAPGARQHAAELPLEGTRRWQAVVVEASRAGLELDDIAD
jgi:hypothetical protein